VCLTLLFVSTSTKERERKGNVVDGVSFPFLLHLCLGREKKGGEGGEKGGTVHSFVARREGGGRECPNPPPDFSVSRQGGGGRKRERREEERASPSFLLSFAQIEEERKEREEGGKKLPSNCPELVDEGGKEVPFSQGGGGRGRSPLRLSLLSPSFSSL